MTNFDRMAVSCFDYQHGCWSRRDYAGNVRNVLRERGIKQVVVEGRADEWRVRIDSTGTYWWPLEASRDAWDAAGTMEALLMAATFDPKRRG